MAKQVSLRVLLSEGQYDLAAHRLVYGLVKARIEQKNGKRKSCRGKSK
jgi:hypothetical protein